jgi:cation:H+ antiporter
MYSAWMIRGARGVAANGSPAPGEALEPDLEGSAIEAAREMSVDAELAGAPPVRRKAYLALLAAIGLSLLVVGGKIFVDGAVGVALAAGMSERLVGLTIVAVGTSLPELATSLIAALRGHSSIAVGNVIGSNIYNVLIILGGAGLARPLTGRLGAMWVDLAFLGALTALSAIAMRTERSISRVEGIALLLIYAAFLLALILVR